MPPENGGDESTSTDETVTMNSAADTSDGRASQSTPRGAQVHPPPPTDASSDESWRQVVGRGMHYVSDVINENIVAARYATMASIVLLSAYGIASTPLFYRFKTVKDIPCTCISCVLVT